MTAAIIYLDPFRRRATGQPLKDRSNVVPIMCPDVDRVAQAVPIHRGGMIGRRVAMADGRVGRIDSITVQCGGTYCSVNLGYARVTNININALAFLPEHGGAA